MFGPVAVGLLYLFTDVKDKGTRVAVTQGTAGATNPFILVNPAGTRFSPLGRPVQGPFAELNRKLSLWRLFAAAAPRADGSAAGDRHRRRPRLRRPARTDR